MAAILDLLKANVSIGTTTETVYFLGKKDDYLTAITTETGVTAATSSEQQKPATKVEELQGKGYLFRLTCLLASGKKRELLCARDKVASALDGLRGKGLAGSTIKEVIVSRKATFS